MHPSCIASATLHIHRAAGSSSERPKSGTSNYLVEFMNLAGDLVWASRSTNGGSAHLKWQHMCDPCAVAEEHVVEEQHRRRVMEMHSQICGAGACGNRAAQCTEPATPDPPHAPPPGQRPMRRRRICSTFVGIGVRDRRTWSSTRIGESLCCTAAADMLEPEEGDDETDASASSTTWAFTRA